MPITFYTDNDMVGGKSAYIYYTFKFIKANQKEQYQSYQLQIKYIWHENTKIVCFFHY